MKTKDYQFHSGPLLRVTFVKVFSTTKSMLVDSAKVLHDIFRIVDAPITSVSCCRILD